MSAIPRTAVISAATAVPVGFLIIAAVLFPAPAAPAPAEKATREVTYLTRIEGIAPGSSVTFRVSDTQTSTVELDAVELAPGQPFEARAALTDLSRAGMQVSILSPFSATVLCEISVDGTSISRIERFIAPPPDEGAPGGGVVTCGTAPPAATTTAN